MFTTGTVRDVYRKDNLSLDYRLILALSRSDDDILTIVGWRMGGGERPEDMFKNSSLKSSRIIFRIA